MKLLGFNKKAQAVRNVIFPIVFLMVFGFINIIGAVLTLSITGAFTTLFPTNTSIIRAAAQFNFLYHVLDYLIFFLSIILLIGIIVTSYRIRSRPIFFIFTFISTLFIGFLGYLFSYIFSQIVSSTELAGVLYIFNLTILLCTNLHWVALIMMLLGAIALYAKTDAEGDEPLR